MHKKIFAGVLVAASLVAAASAFGQSSRRAGTSEVYIGPVFSDGKNYTFDGGSSARTDTGYGLNFGYAYNFDQHLAAGLEFSWSEADYRATVQPGPGNLGGSGTLHGTLETWTVRFLGNYHLLSGPFTPYATAGAGWTYIDTNIPAGLPDLVCWYYPWYGQYCASYVPTHATTKFSYNLGLGLRLDAGKGVFRFLVNSQWADFGGNYGSASLIQYRLDFGTKF